MRIFRRSPDDFMIPRTAQCKSKCKVDKESSVESIHLGPEILKLQTLMLNIRKAVTTAVQELRW